MLYITLQILVLMYDDDWWYKAFVIAGASI